MAYVQRRLDKMKEISKNGYFNIIQKCFRELTDDEESTSGFSWDFFGILISPAPKDCTYCATSVFTLTSSNVFSIDCKFVILLLS